MSAIKISRKPDGLLRDARLSIALPAKVKKAAQMQAIISGKSVSDIVMNALVQTYDIDIKTAKDQQQ